MPSRRQPVLVEVRPDESSTMAPSTPPSPSKAVRFPEKKADIITGITRPLRPAEAWSLYHFEAHARGCPACNRPDLAIMNGERLCDEGRSLAYDVTMHVYHREGQIYSTVLEKRRDIRVEVPPGYDQIVGLLKAIDRRHRKQPKPTINYESMPARAPAVQPVSPTSYVSVPMRSRSQRYSTIIVGGDDDFDDDKDTRSTRPAVRDEKRGSLHKENIKPRPRREYRIEVLDPSEDRQRRRYKDVYY